MNFLTIGFCCFIFCVLQQEIHAIACYTCAAGTDGCGPSFKTNGNGVLPVSVSANTFCAKSVYSGNTNVMTRTTGTTCTAGAGTDPNGYPYTVYCCTTDLCNTASMRKMSIIFASLMAMIGVLLIK
ncbi:unnamed protein product [Adineta steineri]|uniref:UPAR/Ly6 domain-containing protein n=1 Tax=Adineta steineri TaxID=433720 RepID=A0A818QTV8_9BILA|nr:unnamed protein product [Adineta steineri]CAF1235242.1 unnamed protein product [Adineta steineri]CAF3646686.1 unnamed protein product [Adineta steineri]CAF4012075.1 unnamed protein product [Adineta steineri]